MDLETLCMDRSCQVDNIYKTYISPICFVRVSPNCSFVLEKKGKQFIEDCQVKLKPSVIIPTQKITHTRTIE